MKRLLIILAILIPLYGCSEYDLTIDQPIDDINSIPETVKYDEDEVSPQMQDAIYTITYNTNEYALFIQEQDIKRLPMSSNKQGVLKQIEEYKANIAGASLDTITLADEELREVMYNYQYNAEKCIEYMIAFINTGNKDNLEMHKKYTSDLLSNVKQSKVLASKYNLN